MLNLDTYLKKISIPKATMNYSLEIFKLLTFSKVAFMLCMGSWSAFINMMS